MLKKCKNAQRTLFHNPFHQITIRSQKSQLDLFCYTEREALSQCLKVAEEHYYSPAFFFEHLRRHTLLGSKKRSRHQLCRRRCLYLDKNTAKNHFSGGSPRRSNILAGITFDGICGWIGRRSSNRVALHFPDNIIFACRRRALLWRERYKNAWSVALSAGVVPFLCAESALR